MTIGVAESCTGGFLASLFTSLAGASEYFYGGIVSYDNSVKMNILGVSEEVLDTYGAVSQECAEQMATGAKKALGTDYAIATTGIAGPTGGSEAKPVGTVWMAVATPTHTVAVMRNSGLDRGQIISRASAYAIELLYKELKG